LQNVSNYSAAGFRCNVQFFAACFLQEDSSWYVNECLIFCHWRSSCNFLVADREALIDSAIAEVKHQFSNLERATSQVKRKPSAAYTEGKAQGFASLKFERMVKVAEKNILKSRRLASTQASSFMANILATDAFHKPGSILSAQEIAKIYQESECETVLELPSCDSPQAINYRTPDGSCNNLANPTLGAAGTPLGRLISSRYDDGSSRPRGFLQSQDIESLGPFSNPNPSPRIARTVIIVDNPINDTAGHSHMLMQWGQFMDHDLDLVSVFGEEVCPEGCEISEEEEGMCYPFSVPADDLDVEVTRTDSESRGCHEFRRSLPACPPPGVTKLPPREQVNVLTHYIDGSMVYGHSEEIFADLRDLDSEDGLLRVGIPASGKGCHL
jgi:peroxidase